MWNWIVLVCWSAADALNLGQKQKKFKLVNVNGQSMCFAFVSGRVINDETRSSTNNADQITPMKNSLKHVSKFDEQKNE